MRRIAKFKQYRNPVGPRGNGDDEERVIKLGPARAAAPIYIRHGRVNRSSPCAWDDECV